jgi:cobaltochelatase CobS
MSKIKCEECGAEVHAIQNHLKEAHPTMTLSEYQAKHPSAPIFSEEMLRRIEQKKKEATAPAAAGDAATGLKDAIVKKPLHEVFDMDKIKAARSKSGGPIPISTIADSAFPELIPRVFTGYVFDVDEVKNVMLALELNIPTYVWGHKGSGKTEFFEQIAARTGRPLWRNQHTVNTEEAHIVGQWTVKAGSTQFELGPLALAMKNGWLYLADEYDFALPSVLSVYQAVLEGKPLVIKEADAANRVIRPHPNFRFVATGNTNGAGDETGLYQGTSIQNSANYDRFGMVLHKKYMPKESESLILQNHVGLEPVDADKMVDFANRVREAYSGGKISDTISPRALIYASQLGVKRASFRIGLSLSFGNKLSSVDREVVDGIAQRVFG